MTAVLLTVLIAPLLASVIALLAGDRRTRLVGRFGAATAASGLVAAAALSVQVVLHGPIHASLRTDHGTLIGEVSAGRLSALLLVLVYGVSTVVQLFALRYLACDRRSGWFTAGTGLLTTASAGLMISGTLIALAFCWTLAGTALCLLLATYWELPAARDGVRRTATAFALGDLALWSAVGLVTMQWGNRSLSELTVDKDASPTMLVAAVLIVVAALSRSAQIPFHRWLPATLAAPTPVSALLHAGVVNAGGVLLVRLSPIVSGSALAMGIAFTAGMLSMVYGALVMLTKSDIKGSLAYSTMAQMGFMILTCGLGLSAAAVFHLVGHGFYKATLFLSSGSAIAKRRQKAARPPAPPLSPTRRAAVLVTAILVPAAALYAADAVMPLHTAEHGSAEALVIFTWATAAAALMGWLARSPHWPAVFAAGVALLGAGVGYLALVNLVTGFLSPDLPPVAVPSASSLGIAAAAVVLGALALLRQAPPDGWAGRLQRALYTKALVAGHVSAIRPQQIPTPTHLTAQLTGAHR
ncbi:proton-conducting transporter transmembrane domain-containing protein [Mycobacterium sp. Z3061]|uniref:proton-conducting transporter transmembrane domain-containing protein n=1 Tax=Mycobacterium sp. Z3061 TaxID=3073562 RepID=UPI002872ED7A|nr:proton-conducting transporter membrane subunit [Mycobacterium sp. Z3061]